MVAKYTGTDIFLLSPKMSDPETAGISYATGAENGLEQRFRAAIYGDMESVEHAKMRILIMIDTIVSILDGDLALLAGLIDCQLHYKVDMLKLELTMHTLVCGRTRKNIKLIESATKTAIYFPPPFPRVFGYVPSGAHRRNEDEIYITGESQENIMQAKQKLRELITGFRVFTKDIIVSTSKVDSIILDRLDKVRKVMETNSTYVLFQQLGNPHGVVRVQGTEVLHIERTIREIMALVSYLTKHDRH